MTSICAADLLKLAQTKSDWFLSLYMPMEPHEPECSSNRNRFRGLLSRASSALRNRGLATRTVEQFLRPARDLLRSPYMWQEPARGLAVIVDRGEMCVWRLAEPCEELCLVGPRCHLTPLLPTVDDEGTMRRHSSLQRAGRAIDNLHDVLLEAQEGSVASLYVDPRVRVLGMLAPLTGDLRLDDSPRPDSEDLLNLAAVTVLRAGGCVYAMPRPGLVGLSPIVAFIRVTDRLVQMHSKRNGFPARSTYFEEEASHEHQKVSG